jgi:hypothetical protein
MAKIEFPKQLDELLAGSGLFAPVRTFADKAGEILADNKLPFFPDYTDHGIEHVNRVLNTEVELVPQDVWDESTQDSNPRLLCDADAAIIIGATILHDFAMHLHPKGFLELISKESRFQPLPWFKKNNENYSADLHWFELWENYTREVRRFSERQLSKIIGEKSASTWKFDKLPEDPGTWELNHRLVIGEFIRRQHARLAHEIAMYGFPGIPTELGDNQFLAIGEDTNNTIRRIADLIGLTARSHGIPLRVSKEYLDYKYPKMPRPAGAAVLFPMALLRIADYFQIDQSRAPAVLLQLKDPQSPVSVQEWQKHHAVESIGPSNDPRGRMVTVNSDISLPLYLQLKELLESLQSEIDQSTAVLDEMYGIYSNLGLDQLNLSVRRIHSNLQSPAFLESLPYVPEKSGFSTDPNLLSLLVEPLYGNHPGVGVRELMQNAVDAVCELDAWCKKHNKPVKSLDLPDLGCNVLIEFEKKDNGNWILRVQDRGIGMTSDTIQNYFLRAGASFRHSAEWMDEFVDDEGNPQVVRAGRFGIGAFAVFLLGSSFKLWTRPVNADKEAGFSIEVTATSQLIEIQKVSDLQIGTTIEVELCIGMIKDLELVTTLSEKTSFLDNVEFLYMALNNKIDWFCWDWPMILKQVKIGGKKYKLKQQHVFPVKKSTLGAEWSAIYPPGFDAVFWTFGDFPEFSCNGLKVVNPECAFLWQDDWSKFSKLTHPYITIVDKSANLPLTIQRYDLSQDNLPFREELERDVLQSFIAHTLICGPESQLEALSDFDKFPLSEKYFSYGTTSPASTDVVNYSSGIPYRWYTTAKGMVPRDPWLYALLDSRSWFMYGVFDSPSNKIHENLFETIIFKQLAVNVLSNCNTNCAILSWSGVNRFFSGTGTLAKLLFSRMALEGIIDEDLIMVSHLLVSINSKLKSEFEENSSIVNAIQWKYIDNSNQKWSWFETRTGIFDPEMPLQKLLESLEQCLLTVDTDRKDMTELKESIPVLFVAEFRVKTAEEPKTMLAKTWNECLGPRYIPFDPIARAEIIEHGRKHPELKRHIEAWEEMKRTGSKWATGEWRNSDI